MDGSVVQWSGGSGVSWHSNDMLLDNGSWSNGGQNWAGRDGTNTSILDWGYGNLSWGWADWEVGGSDTESVDWISNILGALDESMSIDVGVSSTNNSVSSSRLGLGAWTSGISVAVLAKLILSMVLASMGTSVWSLDVLGRGNSQGRNENDGGMHFDFRFGLQMIPTRR